MATQDVRDSIGRGEGPSTPVGLLIDIAGFMFDRMGPVIDDLNDVVDQVEEGVLQAPGHELRTKLSRLREITDRLTRYVEELDSAGDRAAVTQEELAGRVSDRMNRNMYVLSIVAGIFLPLGLLTGLLGINVGGLPGTDNGRAKIR